MVRIQKTHVQETFATLRYPEIVGPSAGPANGANLTMQVRIWECDPKLGQNSL
jgi:hypothetical protein